MCDARSLSIAALTSVLLTAGCGSDEGADPQPNGEVTIRGSVSESVFAAKSATRPGAGSMVSLPASWEGRVLIVAVDSSANVQQGAIDGDGAFSFPVPAGERYVLMFRDSAGIFLGTLHVDGAARALAAESDLDLGLVTIDPVARVATSSNEGLLLSVASASTVEGPGDVAYAATTTRVSLSLYMPLADGTVVASRGYGSATPSSEGARAPRLSVLRPAWDARLQREVMVEWFYRLACGPGEVECVATLNDKGFKYLTARAFCLAGHEFASGYEVRDWCAPDQVEVGVLYVSGTAPNTFSFAVNRAVDGAVFPDLDGDPRPALLTWNLEPGHEPLYGWTARGLGDVFAGPSPDLPAGTGEGSMRVLCVRVPGQADVGVCPSWASAEFVAALPTTF